MMKSNQVPLLPNGQVKVGKIAQVLRFNCTVQQFVLVFVREGVLNGETVYGTCCALSLSGAWRLIPHNYIWRPVHVVHNCGLLEKCGDVNGKVKHDGLVYFVNNFVW